MSSNETESQHNAHGRNRDAERQVTHHEPETSASQLLVDALPSHKLSDHDRHLINMFWQPGFDEKWINLDETFLDEWVLPGSSLNVNTLYHTILFPNFHPDVDYRICDEGSCIYQVTGFCLKQLCIMCSRSFQRFFIRSDRVAQMLALTKVVEKNRQQITATRLMRRFDDLDRKMDELIWIVNEKLSGRSQEKRSNEKRGEEKRSAPERSDEMETFKLFRIEKAHYVFVRSLKANQNRRMIDGEDVLDEPVELSREHMRQMIDRLRTTFRVKDNHIHLRPKQTENDLIALVTGTV